MDGLVNCAYPRTDDWSAPFEDVSLASWRRNVEMQLDSVFVCCKHALRHMKAQQCGSIVNVGSIYGVVGPDFNVYEGTDLTTPAAYSAIKGGLINFTRYLASLFGPAGVRVNCVSPGGIFNNQPEPFVENYERNVPLQRMGQPEDVAPAVSFLLSDGAAYITGHNLLVDGGWTCK
jgi:NAD(P)-dependent dehydrogenase (short-subunit alcohol dehydrogenase family)